MAPRPAGSWRSALHPFLIGHPHRAKHFADGAGAYHVRRKDVWLTTGGEIADWYKRNYL